MERKAPELVSHCIEAVLEACKQRRTADEAETLFRYFGDVQNFGTIFDGGGLRELVLQMGAHEGCVHTQMVGFSCMWSLARTQSGGHLLCLHGAPEVVYNTLIRHPSLHALHVRGVTALAQMTSSADYLEPDAAKSACQALVFSLRHFPTDVHVLQPATTALALLVQHDQTHIATQEHLSCIINAGCKLLMSGFSSVTVAPPSLAHCSWEQPSASPPPLKEDLRPLELVTFHFLQIIFKLTCTDGLKKTIVSLGAVVFCVKCLEKLAVSERISQGVCGTVWNLALEEANRDELGATVPSVVRVLGSLPTTPHHLQTLLRAATALHHLCRSHDDNLRLLCENRGVGALLHAAQVYPREPQLLQTLSLMLLRISNRHPDALVASPGAIELACQWIASTGDPTVVSNACGTLWNVAMVKDGGAKERIGQMNGVKHLLDTLHRFESNSEIVVRSLTTLWNVLEVESNALRFLELEGYAVFLRALSRYRDKVEVHNLVWGCLFLLLSRYQCTVALRTALIELNATESLLAALRLFGEEVQLNEKVFEILLRLSVDAAGIICHLHGLPLILETLQKYIENPRVAAPACGLLWNFAMQEECRAYVAANPVVRRLVDCMAAHPQEGLVQFRAVTALFKISTFLTSSLTAQGAVPEVLAAMHHHSSNVPLVANALGCLWNVSMLGDESRTAIGLQLGDITECIGENTHSADVRLRGLTLLFHLFSSIENCKLFVQKDAAARLRIIVAATLQSTRVSAETEAAIAGVTCLAVLIKEPSCRPTVTSVFHEDLRSLSQLPLHEALWELGRFAVQQSNFAKPLAIVLSAIVEDAPDDFPPLGLLIAEDFLKSITLALKKASLDMTRTQLLDVLLFSLRKSQTVPQKEVTQDLVAYLTGLLISPHQHLRDKAVALLVILTPENAEVISRPDLPERLCRNLRELTFQEAEHEVAEATEQATPGATDACVVCQEDYTSGETVTEFVCGHCFHTDCLRQWLVNSLDCPCCRMPITAALHDPKQLEKLRNLPDD
eukprot:TRINITY_DN40781_c0_g1_i1.p1 TRINITY_DN40781_c0_g1~~TRINITY_DN40781_c0_g1_i1.p1  ORF type:complete len:1016 (-),score=159.84 TRINITY_DN40781_c0_g1_i1:9-3056(-)